MLSNKQNLLLRMLFAVFISVMHIASVIRIDFHEYAIISLLYIPLRILIWLRYDILRNIAAVVAQASVEISFFCWIALYPGEIPELGHSTDAIGLSMVIGSIVLIIHSSVYFFLQRKESIRIKNHFCWLQHDGSKLIPAFIAFWIFAFTLSLASNALGIARMGVEVRYEAILPFRLAGFITYSRIYAVPFFTVLFTDCFYERNKKALLLMTLLLFASFTVIEAYIRLSRGVLITNFIPIGLWLGYRKIFKPYHLAYFVSLLGVLAVTYPFVSRVRGLLGSGGGDIGAALGDIIRNQHLFGRMETGFFESLYAVIVRGFMEGLHFSKFIDYLEFKLLRPNYMLLQGYDNTIQYHTFVIDKIPMGVSHSSGITLFADSLFLGGITLVLLTAIFTAFFAYAVDFSKLGLFTSTPAHQACVCFYFFTVFNSGFISKILLGEPAIGFSLIAILVAMFVFTKFLGGNPSGKQNQRVILA